MTTGRGLLIAAALLIFAPFAPAQASQPATPDAPSRVPPPHDVLANIGSGGPEAEHFPPPVGRTYAQWPFRPGREGRPVPPRAIPSAPSARSAELEKAKTPLPRPRPDDITGAIKIVPVVPLE